MWKAWTQDLKIHAVKYFVIVYYNFVLQGSVSYENEYHKDIKLYLI
jgi:hypothetical protein